MPETPEQYRNRILRHSEGSDPLKLQAVAAQRLDRLLKGVHASKLRKRPSPDKWSIAEIVLHLGDTETSAMSGKDSSNFALCAKQTCSC
jgi:hypothetical protein